MLTLQERQCNLKVAYNTLTEARREAKRMHKKFHGQFAAYPCQWCGLSHVGHVRSHAAIARRYKQLSDRGLREAARAGKDLASLDEGGCI
jgi:hypothetical protein